MWYKWQLNICWLSTTAVSSHCNTWNKITPLYFHTVVHFFDRMVQICSFPVVGRVISSFCITCWIDSEPVWLHYREFVGSRLTSVPVSLSRLRWQRTGFPSTTSLRAESASVFLDWLRCCLVSVNAEVSKSSEEKQSEWCQSSWKIQRQYLEKSVIANYEKCDRATAC